MNEQANESPLDSRNYLWIILQVGGHVIGLLCIMLFFVKLCPAFELAMNKTNAELSGLTIIVVEISWFFTSPIGLACFVLFLPFLVLVDIALLIWLRRKVRIKWLAILWSDLVWIVIVLTLTVCIIACAAPFR